MGAMNRATGINEGKAGRRSEFCSSWNLSNPGADGSVGPQTFCRAIGMAWLADKIVKLMIGHGGPDDIACPDFGQLFLYGHRPRWIPGQPRETVCLGLKILAEIRSPTLQVAVVIVTIGKQNPGRVKDANTARQSTAQFE